LLRRETRLADTRSDEILESRATQSTGANNGNGSLLQLELAFSR
jgi:hypothetical protein